MHERQPYVQSAIPHSSIESGERRVSLTLPKIIIMTLFVAGLPYDLDDAELTEIFEKFGAVKSAKVVMDRDTGKSKGFGFVEMVEDADGRDAIEHLNDISLGKKPLVVKQAEDRGGGGGGFRGGVGPRSGGGGGGFRGGSGGGAPRGGGGYPPRDSFGPRKRF
jgi:RNA recognition motif-containing protein